MDEGSLVLVKTDKSDGSQKNISYTKDVISWPWEQRTVLEFRLKFFNYKVFSWKLSHSSELLMKIRKYPLVIVNISWPKGEP